MAKTHEEGRRPPLPPTPQNGVRLSEYFLFSPMSDKRRVTPVTPHTGTNFNSYVFTNAQISTMQSNDEFIAEMVRRMEEDKAKKVINMQEEEAPLVPLSNSGSDTEPLLNDDDIGDDTDATLPMSNSWNLLDSDDDLPKLLNMRGIVMGNINIPQVEECDSDGLFSDEEEEKPKRERLVYTESKEESPSANAWCIPNPKKKSPSANAWCIPSPKMKSQRKKQRIVGTRCNVICLPGTIPHCPVMNLLSS